MNAITAPAAVASVAVGSTIQIGRRSFTVSEVLPTGDHGMPRYVFTGVRGAKYTTMRNVHQTHIMFLIHAERGFGMVSEFESVRLSDATGALVVHF